MPATLDAPARPDIDQERRAAKRLREYIAEQVEARLATNDSVLDAPAMVDDVFRHFADDREMIRFLRWAAVRPYISERADRLLRANRTAIRLMELREARLEAEGKPVPVADKMARWNRWYENFGNNQTRRLPTMTKAQLLAAAERREKRAASELQVAAVWRRLAAPMGDDELVLERYTGEQISEAWKEAGITDPDAYMDAQ